MPTLIFLAIAYQVESKKWRYLFLILAGINFLVNLYYQAGVEEFYSLCVAILFAMLTPYFAVWWENRNNRNNPSSFWQFLKETYLIATHNKLRLVSWIAALVISMVSVHYYTNYTNYTLLGSLLAVFLVLYILKKLFFSILPPEWFLHDINTGYVLLSACSAWALSYLIKLEVGNNFILPMLFAVIFASLGFSLVHQKTRYFVPGSALILADMAWQLVRYVQNGIIYTPALIITDIVLIVTMLVGLRWLIKKPGILPIVYLSLFQLFRFSAFSYQAIDHVASADFSVAEVTYYVLYLVCWMYIAPLLFWFVGFAQLKVDSGPVAEKRDSTARLLKKIS